MSKTEAEFIEQIKDSKFAYYGHIDSVNGGGYIVDVNGIKCFMPGSQAQANRILDYNVLVGKTIPVMIDNKLDNEIVNIKIISVDESVKGIINIVLIYVAIRIMIINGIIEIKTKEERR